ncbi:hypothetical protein [Pseudoxanthomonas japonensis]|uniref:HEPN AbiU2-like domain-containing protein n=1 Tax=Pseudoxanthomonas japonensis TaxID=69284 RepID=A0ABQ6ZFJ5_9GAMM|nr:hypothetical protein [Pseudoxanthomonas japonensis]KAF1724330.1 hypothetical protein CSC78_12610 [Pseudoxanthomonas japonensis]
MKERVEAWKQAFEGDEQAVLPTLVNFAWNYAAFMTVVQIVRDAPQDEAGRMKLNSMVLDLLAGGYWANAILAIRRLVDRGPFKGKRGVNSLWALLQDIKASRDNLTRTVYVETIAGLPYDYEEIRDKYWEFVYAQPPGGVNVPRELRYEPSEQRHEEFDWLSGVAADARSPDDLIREDVFSRMEERLGQLDQVADHATIFFAHAATKASRQGRVIDKWGPNEAKQSLQQVAEVAEFVGRWFCFTGIGDILPTAQYDQFEFLDQPLWQGERARLQEQWDAFGEEVGQWPHIDNQAL